MTAPDDLVVTTPQGLYCPAGAFHVDPWAPVPRAVVTHAHGDHLAWGCGHYLMANDARHVASARLGRFADRLETIPYGHARTINGVRLSLHPAGHILGSAQVRLEHRGQVWVVSGDYKTDPDPTCAAWEPVRCHAFITESTFGLPIYRWPPQRQLFDEINAWWRATAESGRTAVLFAYALGKAQRLLAGLDPTIGPIVVHGAVETMTQAYRDTGIALPPTRLASGMGAAARTGLRAELGVDMGAAGSRTRARRSPRADPDRAVLANAMVIAPPSTDGSTWMRRFGATESAFASGWMRVRGARRRRGVARGFTLSDHVDWPQLLTAIDATGAQRVLVTHGFTGPVVRWLRERGLEADAISTRFEGERDDRAVDDVVEGVGEGAGEVVVEGTGDVAGENVGEVAATGVAPR